MNRKDSFDYFLSNERSKLIVPETDTEEWKSLLDERVLPDKRVEKQAQAKKFHVPVKNIAAVGQTEEEQNEKQLTSIVIKILFQRKKASIDQLTDQICSAYKKAFKLSGKTKQKVY